MQFAEAVRYLLSLGHETLAIKLGLTNISLLLSQLSNPDTRYPAVQIAGTNGKGSTAVLLHSICLAADIKAGLFTSPHLTTITERIKIGPDEISPELFASCATGVRESVDRLVASAQIKAPPTFFEQVTAITLLAFARSGVELAILETGLGGRLDATTAAEAQIIGITQIALDHQEHLGDSIEQIASEKAAIIRPGVTAMIAPQSADVLPVILSRCEQTGVQPSVGDCEWQIESFSEQGQAIVTFKTSTDVYPHVKLSLRGRHQLPNAALALRLAEGLRTEGFAISGQEIVEGLETAKHHGRLELINTTPQILLDGAHNAAGASALRAYLNEFVHVPITLVFGAMRDKQLDEMARILFPAAKNLVLTEPKSPRAATVETLSELAKRFGPTSAIKTTDSAVEALQTAFSVTGKDELICVAGSLYLIGETRVPLSKSSIIDN